MIIFRFGQLELQRFCKYFFDLNGYVTTKYFRKILAKIYFIVKNFYGMKLYMEYINNMSIYISLI